jgi:sRNA-binding carbon storage regulator CsrA
MLVLSRKRDEKIIVKVPKEKLVELESDDSCDIEITIVKIDNHNKVRLGIEADTDVVILREELDPKRTFPIGSIAASR